MAVLTQDLSAPTITIDGGAGTGKGDIRNLVATVLGFNAFDSGVLYRALAILAYDLGIDWSDEAGLVRLVGILDVTMPAATTIPSNGEERIEEIILLNGVNRIRDIRSSLGDKGASMVAKLQSVRTALLPLQLSKRQLPGLVIDGRDMGELFDTPFRFFVTVTPEERARRRCLQRHGVVTEVEYQAILADILERDLADTTRTVRPLKRHPLAIELDNSAPGQQVTVAQRIVDYYRTHSNVSV